MKLKIIELAERYRAALRKYMKVASPASLQSALRLGRQAVLFEVELLGLARIHDQTLSALNLDENKSDWRERAEVFFSLAVTPLLEKLPSAHKNRMELETLRQALNRRTQKLAATNRQLQRGVLGRLTLKATLKKRSDNYAYLLKNSLRAQAELRELIHQTFAAQENERQSVSRALQDEIAQILVAINVQLLALKKESSVNIKNLTAEIAVMQRLMKKSSLSTRLIANEMNQA